MKTLKLTENDCTFVHYVLRMYAQQTPGLDSEDKEEIYEVAAKFTGLDSEDKEEIYEVAAKFK